MRPSDLFYSHPTTSCCFLSNDWFVSVAKVANNSRIVIGGQLGNLLFGPVGVPIEDVNGATNSS
jgi:hypothetical protein